MNALTALVNRCKISEHSNLSLIYARHYIWWILQYAIQVARHAYQVAHETLCDW